MNTENDLSKDELTALLSKLSARIDELDAEVAKLKAERPVPEEDLVVIAACAAAYMGYKGKIKAIDFARNTGWNSASRRARTTNLVRGTMPQASL